jgi:flagellar hook assembly protein FlgD
MLWFKLVKTLVNDVLDEGYKTTTWDGSDSNGNPVSSGIYFYRLTAGNRTLTFQAPNLPGIHML